MSWETVTYSEFRGGLDLKTALPNTPDGHSPNAYNFSLAEFGGLEKIKGYSDLPLTGANLPGDQNIMIAYEKSNNDFNRLITADNNNWYSVDIAGNVTRFRDSLSSTSTTSFVVQDEVLYGLDDENDMASWNGTTLNTHAPGLNTGPNRGRILGIWNGQMYVVPAGNQMRIEWSQPFNYTSSGAWPPENFVEITTRNSGSKIMGGSVVGDALILVTDAAIVRITNPVTGSNTVIAEIGTTSGKSLAVFDNVLYGVNRDGLFRTDGNSFAEIYSNRIDPIFQDYDPELSEAAGAVFQRKYFASIGLADLGGSASSNNELTVETYARLDGAMMVNGYPAHYWAVADKINGGQRSAWFIDSRDKSKIRQAFVTNKFIDQFGADADIECWYELPPDDFGDPHRQKRVQQIRVVGKGERLQIGLKLDYTVGNPSSSPLGFPGDSGGLWDFMQWDLDSWGGTDFSQGYLRVSGRAREFSFFLYEKSQGDETAVGTGDRDAGAASVYIVEPRFARTNRYR